MIDTEKVIVNVTLTLTAGDLNKLHIYCDKNAYDLHKLVSKIIREKLLEEDSKVGKTLLVG